jgi:hypothetical protein
MLLANMAKEDSIERLLTRKRTAPKGLSKSDLAIDQLMDLFVRGADGSYHMSADYDYLAYLFADLAKVSRPHPLRLPPPPRRGPPGCGDGWPVERS